MKPSADEQVESQEQSRATPERAPESLKREFMALLVLYAVLAVLPLLALWLES